MSRLARASWLACACVILTACGGAEHQDIKSWMKESTKGLSGQVQPLPEVKPLAVVSYNATALVDPFRPTKIEPEKISGGGANRPDFDRRKEPLEALPLESLKLVGMLQKGKMRHAIIRASNGIYQVKIGNYMGQNFGIITDIDDNEVKVRELVQDSTGDWVERTSTLQLQEEETKK